MKEDIWYFLGDYSNILLIRVNFIICKGCFFVVNIGENDENSGDNAQNDLCNNKRTGPYF